MGFPGNVVTVAKDKITLATYSPAGPGGLNVAGRPLRTTDPNFAVSVFEGEWHPKEFEIAGGQFEPAVSTYDYYTQTLIKHAVEEEGRVASCDLAKFIRGMLYRDEGLQLALRALSETSMGTTDRLKRWGVKSQRFYANQIGGQFVFLSSLEWWVEIETVLTP